MPVSFKLCAFKYNFYSQLCFNKTVIVEVILGKSVLLSVSSCLLMLVGLTRGFSLSFHDCSLLHVCQCSFCRFQSSSPFLFLPSNYKPFLLLFFVLPVFTLPLLASSRRQLTVLVFCEQQSTFVKLPFRECCHFLLRQIPRRRQRESNFLHYGASHGCAFWVSLLFFSTQLAISQDLWALVFCKAHCPSQSGYQFGRGLSLSLGNFHFGHMYCDEHWREIPLLFLFTDIYFLASVLYCD